MIYTLSSNNKTMRKELQKGILTNNQPKYKTNMKTYRIRLYRKGSTASFETYYVKATNEKEAVDKAIIQLQAIDNGVFSSIHSIDLY